MKKQNERSEVCELWPCGQMPAYPTSSLRTILLISLLLSANTFAATPGMDMSNMPMEKGAQSETAMHHGKGKVVSVDKANLTIKLAHEAIKSLGWSRMLMDFKVVNAALLEGIKAGDTVTFELGNDADTDTWQITRLKKQESGER